MLSELDNEGGVIMNAKGEFWNDETGWGSIFSAGRMLETDVIICDPRPQWFSEAEIVHRLLNFDSVRDSLSDLVMRADAEADDERSSEPDTTLDHARAALDEAENVLLFQEGFQEK